jgi:hypothetical protein
MMDRRQKIAVFMYENSVVELVAMAFGAGLIFGVILVWLFPPH